MFEEFLVVFSHCRRCQFVLIAGFAIAIVLLLVGDHIAAGLHLDPPFDALTEPFQNMLRERYGKAAMGIVGGSVLTAWRAYRKTRKRIGLG